MKIVIGLAAEKNTGFAISDLSGKVIKLFAVKSFDKSKLVEYISSFGKPCAIVVDKEKIPKIAKDLAREFDIPVLAPEKDISETEKKNLTNAYTYKNIHERDALAALLYMFSRYKKIFREIDEILKNMGYEEYSERAKELVLRGNASTPFQAIENVLPFPIKEKRKKKPKTYKEKYEEALNYIKKLQEKIKELEKENKTLLNKSLELPKELLEKIKKLEKKIIILEEELARERELRKRAEEKLGLIEEEKYIEKQGLIPAVRIKEFSFEHISFLKESIRIFKKPVVIEEYADDLKAAKYLVKLHPLIIIGDFSEEVKALFLKEKIPFISKKEVKEKIIPFHRFYGIASEVLEEILEKGKKKSFFEWLLFYKKRIL